MNSTGHWLSLSSPETRTLCLYTSFVLSESQSCLGCISFRLRTPLSFLPCRSRSSFPRFTSFFFSSNSNLGCRFSFTSSSSQRFRSLRSIAVSEKGERDSSNRKARDSGSEREANPLESNPGPKFTAARNTDEDALLSRGDLWGDGPQPFRRMIVAGLVGTSVILGGNLAGISSLLLGLNPSFSRGTRADLIFPVQGFKRCLETTEGFEFIYPARWVGDQRLLYRAVERAERERSLELPSLRGELGRSRRKSVVEPVVAYGPPGSDGELNVSVVVAPVASGFSLEMLGTPKEAAERFLGKIIAPPGSDKVAVLLDATQRQQAGVLYYATEYIVKGPAFVRHNVAVYAACGDLLYTLNAQTAESMWDTVRDAFVIMADSFKVTGAAGSGTTSIPRLL